MPDPLADPMPGPTPGPRLPQASVHHQEVGVGRVRLATITATPTQVSDPAPLVVTLGILARLDDVEVQRFALLADLLGRPVVALDTPGWLVGRGGMPAAVRHDLRRRDFAPLAALMADALHAARPDLVTATLSVLGYSLGASTGSALAAELVRRGATLRAIDLIEPVAVRPQTMAELTWRHVAEARHGGTSDRHTDALDWTATRVGRPPLISPLDVGLLAWAISRGGIRASLEPLPLDVPVTIVSGELSSLSPTRAVHRLARHLAADGRPVSVHVVPGAHHALWNSLTHVADIARLLR